MKHYGDQMNVVLYVNSSLPKIGGREFAVHYLAASLQELGHRVRVVGPAGWLRLRKWRFSYPVHRWPTLRGLFPEQVAFSQVLADTVIWPCDVIHAHNTYPAGYVAARLKRIRRIPLVITPHGADVHVVPELGRGLRLNPEIRTKIDYALHKAERVTAISTSVKAALIDAGACPGKVRLISNGVDVERFSRLGKTKIPEWLNVSQDAGLILMVGSYGRNRGYEIAIRAMPQVLAAVGNARLIIVGYGSEILNSLIRDLGLHDKVILTGAIRDLSFLQNGPGLQLPANQEDKLAALYCSSAVYVNAGIAEGSEGLSLALLEAMAAGLPVVATRISGNRDVIREGENGWLVEPGSVTSLAEHIIQLLRDRERRERMGSNGRKVAEEFTWRKIALQYVSVYQEAQELALR